MIKSAITSTKTSPESSLEHLVNTIESRFRGVWREGSKICFQVKMETTHISSLLGCEGTHVVYIQYTFKYKKYRTCTLECVHMYYPEIMIL